MRSVVDRRALIGWTSLCAIALFLFSASWISSFVRNTYEDALFAIAPSAARASAYGERHFASRDPGNYDIARAEHFYRAAEALDPSYPYTNHQLARIEFIRGNLHTALFYSNKEVELHGTTEPNAYYVRGLIEGYMGRYADAVQDYERYLRSDPDNWAAMNDYAWVLLKANRPKEAVVVTSRGLSLFPDNAWLLNSNTIALYESGDLQGALVSAQNAVTASQKLAGSDILKAYPGNDPRVASVGVETLRRSAAENMHRIERALASSAVQ